MRTRTPHPDTTGRRRPGAHADDRAQGRGHPAMAALELQRAAGNRGVAGLVAGGAGPALMRAPATAPAAAPASEIDRVRAWIAAGETGESRLTDRVFFERHPDLVGARLVPGSDQAKEWLAIRATVVRPALADPTPSAPPVAPTATPEEGMGDGGASQPGGIVEGVLTAIGDALAPAVSAGDQLLDEMARVGSGIADWWWGETPADTREPEVVVPVPVEPEPQHQRGDAYKSQRDNESAHVGGDVSCSPTSFTMALIDLHGGDEESVRSQTIALIAARGGSLATGQTEDLVIDLIQRVDWDQATADKPAYFWDPTNWADWAEGKYGGNYYKDPNAQQYVASLYSGVGGSAEDTHAHIYTQAAWAPVITALAEGAVATAQGAFTSDGHVVDIVQADDAGVVINDPFGLWLRAGSGYGISNGTRAKKLTSAMKTEFDRRAQVNGTLTATYEAHIADTSSDEVYGAWGERNFYTWADVEDVQLGKWVSILRPAAS
ncbi:MAG: hypothetical protein AB7I08_00370 [Thermoleophilia bacterium]